MDPDVTLEFFATPQPFLDAAGGLLAAEPVLGSVIASVSERTARELAAGHDSWAEVGATFERWWVVVRDASGAVVSAAMRTAPFAPHPTFSMPMDDGAATALATALHARGELLGGANGALPGAAVLARVSAELTGGEVVADKGTRLWEATSVEAPPAPDGRLRLATEDDAELVLAWFRAFHEEADEQAGREPDPDSGEHNTLDSVLVRIREGVEWLWELPDGTVAHLTGAGLPSYGVSRIGPVYTPKEHRGRGIASYVVGELTRRGLEAGHRMCLFTDRANPTSNKIYAALGYEPTVDMAEHVVGLPGHESSSGQRGQ
ncbi:GNAT family N-acetyltransferase [Nocardioides sp. zg-1228]|uniref:GNAT family N-acetyltransferase n=1 Tax=Nocardioides sp. zg-1228 TaxID=2763008 RepID=UPI001642D8CC|nr:GNAT family N-acetyltransferase [Nocardioides sp. zg-1228]MBC2933206.1 GNAT family N-acetyltransferase [Nocardioides sp. zg-1228]QSF56623.1 GNAT family N-acetyltransferase [Nocardioides sp. zg-1228]